MKTCIKFWWGQIDDEHATYVYSTDDTESCINIYFIRYLVIFLMESYNELYVASFVECSW